CLVHRLPPRPTLFPYTTLFRSASTSASHWTKPPRAKTSRRCGRCLLRQARPCPRSQASRKASSHASPPSCAAPARSSHTRSSTRSEEHTSELQSRENLVCRLLL